MDDFVEELERAKREWARLHGGARMKWNALWRARIVEWVRTQQGKSSPYPPPIGGG